MLTGMLTVLIIAGAATAAVVAIQRRNVIDNTTQQIRESLASAHTAIESNDLSLAEARLAEATILLRQAPTELSLFTTEIEKANAEVAKSRSDQERLKRFLELSRRAQDGMSYNAEAGGDRVAEEALALYGVLSDPNWQQGLDSSSSSDEEKKQVRQTAYWTLICLADFQIRWQEFPGDRRKTSRCLALLDRAKAIREPTRAFYWIQANAEELLHNLAARDAILERLKAAPIASAWDYYLEGHTAGWHGDVDAAMAAYRQALRIEPDHFNSLIFLGKRLSEANDYRVALGYLTACIASRPQNPLGYVMRGQVYLTIEEWEEAAADLTEAIEFFSNPVSKQIVGPFLRSAAFDHLGRFEEAIRDRRTAMAALQMMVEKDPEEVSEELNNLVWYIIVSACNCKDLEQRRELWDFGFALVQRFPAQLDSQLPRLLAERGGQLSEDGQFVEAEPFLRECVEIRSRHAPDDYSRYIAMSLLGEALRGQHKFAEAETLLLDGYNGLLARDKLIDGMNKHLITAAAERIVRLYEAWDRPEDAARWRNKVRADSGAAN
jgi:tetratricopeptide (TPR) repeat protein